jgi:hypothetical protein
LTRARLRLLAVAAAALTLAVMAAQLIGARSLLLPGGQVVFGDYLAFWSAGRLALEGRADEIYSVQAIAAAQQQAVPGLNVVFPWRSPPPFLMIAAPVALLPFPASAILFLAASAALFTFAARKLAPNPADLLFALTMPVVLLHIGSVQTGLLVAGLTALAFHWLDRRPLAAGACVGLLAIKPHLAILWPIFLAVQGRWRAFGAAGLTITVFVAIAGAMFGFELYPLFLGGLAHAQRALDLGTIDKDTFASLYANLIGLGLPRPLALAVHWLSALAAIALAVGIWRREKLEGTIGSQSLAPGRGGPSASAFVCATLLFSPYLFFYDGTLILIAIAALYRGASAREQAWLAFAWISGAASLALGKLVTIPLCPIAAWALLWIAANRVIRWGRGRPARISPRTAPLEIR